SSRPRCSRLAVGAAREDLHRAIDWNSYDAGVAIDPAVRGELLFLSTAELDDVAPWIDLESWRGRQLAAGAGDERIRRRAQASIARLEEELHDRWQEDAEHEHHCEHGRADQDRPKRRAIGLVPGAVSARRALRDVRGFIGRDFGLAHRSTSGSIGSP